MKKYKVIRRMLFILLLLYIFLLLGKNMDFFKKKLLLYPYEKVEARITNVIPMHNRIFNLRTEVVYIYRGKQETAQVYYMIGDAVGQKVWLILSDNKIARNCFIFSWADLQCIVMIGILIYYINMKYKEFHYQAAMRYAKKLYERQLSKEDTVKEQK